MSNYRKPTVLKIAHGTERADRRNPDEPQGKIYDGGPPSYLNKEALEVWHQYAEILRTSGILTEKDVEVFASFCMIAAEKRKFAKKRIKKEDLRLFGDLVTKERLLAASLGMTPVDNSRVIAARNKDGEKSVLEKMWPGKGQSR